MASGSVKLSLAAALLCIVIGAKVAEAAMSCNQVVSDLAPCVSFVTSGGTPSMICCNGVRTLNSQAQTTADRQGACQCLKSVIVRVSYNPSNVANAAALPARCGVNFPYKISPSIDCKSIRK
ncbi:non-specific lipid-transfer protein 1-like [Momordica charantia]|uniref:Non-specific lipid-transfer protein n=1 Tax=Momordica charantia TaxID=3673 RepID=A0A6J1CQM5_MOMCH|nr:non-specific lipid-transfer protein 1-like [Momordica charantia]